MWRQLAAAWSTPYGFPPYLPSQRFDFQRYHEAPEDAVTSSSEFQETETTGEEYFAPRSREGERADPCPSFDPISAFYPPKTTEQETFETNASDSQNQKSAKASMMIDNLLNVRSENCSQADIKWELF